jgi:hypothetical protein
MVRRRSRGAEALKKKQGRGSGGAREPCCRKTGAAEPAMRAGDKGAITAECEAAVIGIAHRSSRVPRQAGAAGGGNAAQEASRKVAAELR